MDNMDEDIKKLLTALLAISMENRSEEARKIRKDEKLLIDFGIKAQDVALILNKSPAAAAKAIQRAKRK